MKNSAVEPQALSRQVALLQNIGEGLYGPRWQTDLSTALSVNDRSMRRWISGEDPIPRGVWNDLRLLIQSRWVNLREFEYQINDLYQVTVYRFKKWNQQAGDFDLSPGRATASYIKNVGCEIVDGTERRVDAWDVDADGRYIRSDGDTPRSVSDVMATTAGYGFNLLNGHRAPLVTLEYPDREAAVRMRRLFQEACGRAIDITVHNYG
jgi:hypothetical protein